METVAAPGLAQSPNTPSPALTTSETEKLRQETLAMNEALVLGSVRQHELTEAAENLNVQLEAEIVAHQKVAQELAEKARLLDLTTDAIYVRDSEGRITYWNHGAEQLYGWSKAEALGKLSHVLLQTEFPLPIRLITAELHERNRWTGELVHTKRDGRRITVLVRKTLDRDASGKPVGVLQNITDITHRKVVEDELRQARTRLLAHAKELDGVVAERTAELSATNRQLEAFVYTIAHDLRAPLRSMQGFSQLLVEEAGAALSPIARDYALRIDKSAQFLDALLGDLLEFSRIRHQLIVTSAADLTTVVESVLSRLELDIQEKHATVRSPGPWPGRADPRTHCGPGPLQSGRQCPEVYPVRYAAGRTAVGRGSRGVCTHLGGRRRHRYRVGALGPNFPPFCPLERRHLSGHRNRPEHRPKRCRTHGRSGRCVFGRRPGQQLLV